MKKTIFLVSGIGLRPDLKLIKYWRRAPQILESLGYEVVVVDVDAFGALETNLEIIYQRISDYLSKNTDIKVECHVWGHSKGGLEVLNLLTKNTLNEKISSFVLLNPPIQGSAMARRILKSHSIIRKIVVFCANTTGFLMGDRYPDLETALKGLARDHRALLATGNNNLYVFQSSHAFRDLPWVWKPAALMAYGRGRNGDGIVEFQNLDGSNAKPIRINSVEMGRIMHSTFAGIPYFSGVNSEEFRNIWLELVDKVFNSKILNQYSSSIDIKNGKRSKHT